MLEQDKNTFLKHYRSMFQAVQNEDLATANNYREKMEQIRLNGQNQSTLKLTMKL